MKQNEITDNEVQTLDAQNLENMFNVYTNDTDDTYYYNILKTVNFPEDLVTAVYDEYETQPGDTWPLIAWKHYTNVKLWWIICAVNQIQNPVGQPEPGTKIKIIAADIVREVLTEIKDA